MRNRAHDGRSAGWRSVFDRELWRQGLIVGAAGAVSMAILACTVALARDTTRYQWYAAARITAADLMIAAGFDEDAPIEFRKADGAVEPVSRSHLTFDFDARWARDIIMEGAWKSATLGALSGFGGALLCLALVWKSTRDRRGRRPANEPAPEPALARTYLASPSLPATAATTHAPADRLSASEPPLPAKPESIGTRQDRPDTGKHDKAVSAGRGRGERTYGRWV